MRVVIWVQVPMADASCRGFGWLDFRQLVYYFGSEAFFVMSVTNVLLYPASIRKREKEVMSTGSVLQIYHAMLRISGVILF